MREVHATLGKDIRLGRRGESHARCVIFDVSEWQSLYGEGMVHLLHQRNGDAVPYPCQISVDGGVVCWVVTGADVAIAGRGRAELQYHVGEICVKSDIYTTNTVRSMSDAGPVPPEPQEGWVEQVLNAAGVAEQSAQQAQESVAHYPKVQDGTWWVWDAEADTFVDTGNAASGVYVGSGDMPEGCSVQIDPQGEVLRREDLIGPAGPKGDKGDKGDPGPTGQNGAPGYTPVRGVDYFTPKDVEDIVAETRAQIAAAEKYVLIKEHTFDSNNVTSSQLPLTGGPYKRLRIHINCPATDQSASIAVYGRGTGELYGVLHAIFSPSESRVSVIVLDVSHGYVEFQYMGGTSNSSGQHGVYTNTYDPIKSAKPLEVVSFGLTSSTARFPKNTKIKIYGVKA